MSCLMQSKPYVSSGCECTSGKSGLHKAFPFTAPPQIGLAYAERQISCTARLCWPLCVWEYVVAFVYVCASLFQGFQLYSPFILPFFVFAALLRCRTAHCKHILFPWTFPHFVPLQTDEHMNLFDLCPGCSNPVS